MAVADRHGLPVAVCITSASPHEVTLVDETLDAMFVDDVPAVLIGDKAYDSDPLDKRLQTERGIELVVRYERHAANFLGFVQLGCMLILLRYF